MPELGLFPLPQLFLFALHPRPSPREGVNEAGLGEAGRRPSVHRCLQVFPWWPDPGLAPLCSCLSTLPDMGWWLIPLWGGVGAILIRVVRKWLYVVKAFQEKAE